MRLKNVLVTIGLALFAAPTLAEVGVSVTVGEPGFFGHIELGDAPRPVLVTSTPVVIEEPPPRVVVAPLYVYVPAAERKDWRRHCHRYDACGRPVYFVRESWYRDVYVPHYRQHRAEYDRLYHRDDHHHEHDHDHDHDHDKSKHCPPGQAKKGNC